jgi:UDP:flavonoid glycosyltransferase YjiC (YdhE family)
MLSNKLTVLMTPLDGWGHINCCHGLAEELQNRGHRVVFAVDIAFKDKLRKFGFEEELLSLPNSKSKEVEEYWPKFIEENGKSLMSRDASDVMAFCVNLGATKMASDVRAHDHQYRDIIQRVNPDLIITDAYVDSPAITKSGRPWIWLYSAAPLGLLNTIKERCLPPSGSGLPLHGDKQEWDQFKLKLFPAIAKVFTEINEFTVSKGAPPLEPPSCHPRSPYLNIYLYPQELDYKEVYPLPPNIIRVENFIRHTSETFEIPESLRQRPGKLVFLSMGSFGCANLHLMTRVTTILGKSQHKFIVSKGPLHDKYSLPDNMWGQRFLPQTAILPLVDLVVTHGGNNTVTETFYYGKPMLVLPLFGDQYDNAQRLHETALGLRLNPFYCTERELIDSVDKLLSDVQLTQRMTTIGQRIRNTNDKKVISDLIEHIVHQN